MVRRPLQLNGRMEELNVGLGGTGERGGGGEGEKDGQDQEAE